MKMLTWDDDHDTAVYGPRPNLPNSSAMLISWGTSGIFAIAAFVAGIVGIPRLGWYALLLIVESALLSFTFFCLGVSERYHSESAWWLAQAARWRQR